ncbi:hypothetical protein E2986_12100 [Frieseomelitta varia]|uniref:Uncharacterized protein n=1 Tax=Frieseomelitta varia TaxID=561572 RepID=A0A833W2N2_9HYME|nr:hypothetical protein E2986_12100 [Frieseomelitta varia]
MRIMVVNGTLRQCDITLIAVTEDRESEREFQKDRRVSTVSQTQIFQASSDANSSHLTKCLAFLLVLVVSIVLVASTPIPGGGHHEQ